MAKRPWIIVVLAALHGLAPIGNLIFNALWAGVSPSFYIRIAVQPENLARLWPSIVLPFIAGVAIYQCKKESFFVFLTCMLGLFIYSVHGYFERGGALILIQLILAFGLNIGLVTYFLIPAVREIYMNKKLRWWESEDRFSWDQSCHFNENATQVTGAIANISKSGLFVSSSIIPADNSKVTLRFDFCGREVQIQGVVVHHGPKQGFGLRFTENNKDRALISQIVNSLQKEGRLVRARTTSAEGSFSQWLKELARSGKGLLPRTKR